MRSGVGLRFDTKYTPLLVGAAFLVLSLHDLGASDIVGDDEAREAGIVRDVLAGHWLWPRFNDELIPDKPILFHWVAALPCAASGFSETAVRLPSALAAAALVAWTTWFGMRALGPAAGLAAGVLTATFPALFDRARLARPDTLMLLLLAAALGLAYTAWRNDRQRDAFWAVVLVGLATFVKGPVAPALFATTLGAFLLWQRQLGRVRLFVTVPAIAAFLVLGGGWYVVALAGWDGEFVRQHLVGRYLRNLAGGLAEGRAYSPKSLTYHLTFYPLHLPAIALPWTPLLVAALVRLGRRRGFAHPLVRFLVCWVVAPVFVFTPAEYKLRYYLLPSLPPLALLAAPFAAE
ncbi:MAG: ArnT family glycosyltransferase, partial [Candidatus Binatia bacterium]